MPFLTQGKTNWKYILIVVVLSVVVGGGILGWIKKQEVPPAELPEIKKPETTNWETYKNEEFGFQIKYPPSLKFISTGPNLEQQKIERGETISGTVQPSYDTIIFSDEDNKERFKIGVFHPREKSVFNTEYLYLFGPCDFRWGFEPTVTEEVTVNNIDILKVEGKQLGPHMEIPTFQTCCYFRNYNKNLIVLSTVDFDSPSDFEEVNSILKNVIQTLALSEIDETANWKTYRNEEYGFEMKYPEDWQLFQPGPKAFAGLNLIHLEIFKIEKGSFYGRVFLHLFTDYEKSCEEFKIEDLKSLWFDLGFKEVLVKRRSHQCFTFSYIIDREAKETEEFKTSFIKNFQKSFSILKFIKGDVAEDWKVYQNRNKGFEIRYPSNLLVTEVEEEPLPGVAFHTSTQWVIGPFGPPNGMVIEVKEELGGKKAKDIKNIDELKEAIEEEFAPLNVKLRRVTLPFASAFVVDMGTNKYFQYDYYAKNEDKIVKFSLIDAGAIFSPFNQMLSTFRFLE